MKSLSREIVFLGAKRTAFGTFGGTLKDLTATDLAVQATRAALAQAGVDAQDVDQCIVGNVSQTSTDAVYVARHVALRSGMRIETPALAVNRLCGSGFQSIIAAAEQILLGRAECVLAAGAESMSMSPLVLRGTRWGFPLGKMPQLEDSLWAALTDSYVNMPMAITAENLAVKYGITQDEVDEFSVTSQKRFAAAQEAGRLAQEIVGVEIDLGKKGKIQFAKDEHNRPETTALSLKRLPKVFKKDGVIHAGAASGISDGAGALVVASREFAAKRGVKPIGRLHGWGLAGVDPAIMGIGPAPAIRNALASSQSKLEDYDLVEVNEAFSPQYLAVEKELGLDRAKTNVDGGAIAVGHPLAASGSRITMHLLYELKRRKARLGIGSACIGGGQGIAVLVEAL